MGVVGDTVICPGDSININLRPTLNGGGWGGGCTCMLFSFQWYKDGVILPGDTNFILYVTIPGTYRVSFTYDCSFKNLEFTIAYNNCVTTTVNNPTESSIQNFSLYPDVSTGIFKIKFPSSSTILKQLRITDNAGRIVFASSNNFSEINLSNFSPGIYYYAITDEKENIYRGRIVKE